MFPPEIGSSAPVTLPSALCPLRELDPTGETILFLHFVETWLVEVCLVVNLGIKQLLSSIALCLAYTGTSVSSLTAVTSDRHGKF